jgi:hypothetical protein
MCPPDHQLGLRGQPERETMDGSDVYRLAGRPHRFPDPIGAAGRWA